MSAIGFAFRRALPIVVWVGTPAVAAIAAMGVTLHWTDFDELAPSTTTTIIEAPVIPPATTGTYPPLRLPEPLLGPLPVPPLPTTTTEAAITFGLPTVPPPTPPLTVPAPRPRSSPPTVPPMPTAPTLPPVTTVPDPTTQVEPTIPPTTVAVTTTTLQVTTTTGLIPAVGRECALEDAEVTILTAPLLCVGGVWQLKPAGP